MTSPDQIRDVPEQTDWDALDLLAHDFPPLTYAVAGLVPEGAGLVTGAPKSGKSLLIRDIALAVAAGEPLWAAHDVTRGRALWLCLEDGARRAKERITARPGQMHLLRRGDLRIRTVSKRLAAGGLEEIEQWIEATPGAALVVIDVFARVRDTDAPRNSSVYAADYASLEPLQKLAARYRVAMPIVHHNRKASPSDDDPFESISGTNGLLGAVDWALVLQRHRNSDVGVLHGAGRDLHDFEMALAFRDGLWSPSPMPVELAREPSRIRAVWQRLDEAGPSPTNVIADWYGQNAQVTAKFLHRLSDKGMVDQLIPPAPGRPALWSALR